ncbi:MAG: hypothetical protein ACR2KB_06570 [Chitinophagaceae bacterium]
MDYKEQIQKSYNRIVEPLKSYSGETNTIDGMLDYMQLFGEVMLDFASTMNNHYQQLTNIQPGKSKEIENYINQLKSKLIKNYKPK